MTFVYQLRTINTTIRIRIYYTIYQSRYPSTSAVMTLLSNHERNSKNYYTYTTELVIMFCVRLVVNYYCYGGELISCYFIFPLPFFYGLYRAPHCMTQGENDDPNGVEQASVVRLIQVLQLLLQLGLVPRLLFYHSCTLLKRFCLVRRFPMAKIMNGFKRTEDKKAK